MRGKCIEIAPMTGTYTDITGMLMETGYSVRRVRMATHERSKMTYALYEGKQADKCEVTCICGMLTQAEISSLFSLLKNEYIMVNFQDPDGGWRTGVKFVAGDVPATSLYSDGTNFYWSGVSFTLTEV